MVIDVHNHPDWYGYNRERLLANMDEGGIDVTVLLSWELLKADYIPSYFHNLPVYGSSPYAIPFEYSLPYAEKYPDRFWLGYCPDPRMPDAIGRLRAAAKMYPLRICGELKLRMMYDNPDALAMYRVCGELGLPVLVHIDYEMPASGPGAWPSYWFGGGMAAFERAIAACPETVFIGHAPGFWAHISGDDRYLTESYPAGPVLPGGDIPRMLRKYSNLYCDISAGSGHRALSRDLEFSRGFLTEFQDRILFGRDYFDHVHRELLEKLALPAPVMEKINCQNALKILRRV